MITVSLPDSPLRLVPGAVWRFVVPTWLHSGSRVGWYHRFRPAVSGKDYRLCSEIDHVYPMDSSTGYPIWLSSVVQYSTRDRFSLHSRLDQGGPDL